MSEVAKWRQWGSKNDRQNYYRNQVTRWGVDLLAIFFFKKKIVYNDDRE